MKPLMSGNEVARLAVLREYHVLEASPPEELDSIAGLAAHVCEAPFSSITLVDEQRERLLARFGFAHPESPRDVSFSAAAILASDFLIVPDASKDARFAANPMLSGKLGVRFCAAVPLKNKEGHCLGAVCVMDKVARHLDPRQVAALRDLTL